MATVAVLLDLEEGHSLPNFGLLRLLKTRGHRVCCLGLREVEEMVRRQGFEFIPVLEEILPQGSVSGRDWIEVRSLYFGPLVRGKVLDSIVESLRPDVLILHSHYYAEGVAIHYRYRLPVVFVVASFRVTDRRRACEFKISETLLNLETGVVEFIELLARAGIRIRKFDDAARLVLQFPELVLIPEAFDLPGRALDPGVTYIGAGVDADRQEEPLAWAGQDSTRPLIYCALGSQNHRVREISARFFRAVLEVAAKRPDWDFAIAIGRSFNVEEFSNGPPNASVTQWAPQLRMLARARVMVNHGGWGTVKECVLMGVPMACFPLLLERDHVACAERVVYHGLGLSGKISEATAPQIESSIERLIADGSFHANVSEMREKFKRQDRLVLGAEIVEQAISGSQPR